MNAGFPIEEFGEAVAERCADGTWRPRNAAMDRLLAARSATGDFALEVLVPDPEGRALLERGEPVQVEIGGECTELRIPASAEGAWLLARSVETVTGLRLAAARPRALAQLAGSIAHDLANLFGAAIGIAETLSSHVRAEEDRRTLVQLIAGVRRGAELAAALEKQLRQPSRRRGVAAIDAVFEDLQRLFGKAATRNALAVTCACDAALPSARADAASLLQLLLQTLFLGTQIDARSAALGAAAVDTAIAGGRSRRCVRITCELRGCALAAVHRITAAFDGHDGWLQDALNAPEATRDLLLARLVVQRAGGVMELRGVGDVLLLDVLLPASGTSAQA